MRGRVLKKPHWGDHYLFTIHLESHKRCGGEGPLPRGPGGGEFEDNWLIKSSFINLDEMKVRQLNSKKTVKILKDNVLPIVYFQNYF